jgi:hypothetical protein
MTIAKTLKYGLEIPLYAPTFRREIIALGIDGLDSTLTMTDSGSAIFAASVYDLAAADKETNIVHRHGTRRLGGMSMKYANLIDDAIDDPTLELTPSQKRSLLTNITKKSWGEIEDTNDISEVPEYSRGSILAIRLGNALHAEVNKSPEAHIFEAAIAECLAAESSHAENTSPEDLLESAIDLGRASGNLMSSSAEVISGQIDPAVIKAVENLGVYGILLDHIYEVEQDLKDNSPTVMTAMIKRDGDSTVTRASARELLLDYASSFRKSGSQDLSPRQKAIFSGVATLFDVRYKLALKIEELLKK